MRGWEDSQVLTYAFPRAQSTGKVRGTMAVQWRHHQCEALKLIGPETDVTSTYRRSMTSCKSDLGHNWLLWRLSVTQQLCWTLPIFDADVWGVGFTWLAVNVNFQLTIWCRDVLEKLIVANLGKKFPACYETHNFIAVHIHEFECTRTHTKSR
jgi:hypothetical protein